MQRVGLAKRNRARRSRNQAATAASQAKLAQQLSEYGKEENKIKTAIENMRAIFRTDPVLDREMDCVDDGFEEDEERSKERPSRSARLFGDFLKENMEALLDKSLDPQKLEDLKSVLGDEGSSERP